jgi:hypothetical protein
MAFFGPSVTAQRTGLEGSLDAYDKAMPQMDPVARRSANTEAFARGGSRPAKSTNPKCVRSIRLERGARV